MTLLHHHAGTGRFRAVDATSKRDPTGTGSIRKRFESEIVRRFRRFRAEVIEALGKLDVFGLSANDQLPPPKAFQFLSSKQKIESFMDWLRGMEEEQIFGVLRGTSIAASFDQSWMNVYIDSAYRKGLRDAGQKIGRAGEFVSAAFNRPIHADRVGIIYARTYTDLLGITEAMDQRISRALATGIAEGRGPMDMARRIAAEVDGVGIARARTLARTETINAHAEATLNLFEEAKVQGVEVEAEFVTAGDDSVCPECEELEGKVMTISEARGLIPVHPNCRCAYLPVVDNVGDAEWNEEDHPRDPDGTFASGGGGSSGEAEGGASSFPEVSEGDKVDGLVVTGSPGSEHFKAPRSERLTEVAGIRAVPMSALASSSPIERTPAIERLAAQIKESGTIRPLVLIQSESEGLYIIDGFHRWEALRLLGKTEFPAKIYVDPK